MILPVDVWLCELDHQVERATSRSVQQTIPKTTRACTSMQTIQSRKVTRVRETYMSRGASRRKFPEAVEIRLGWSWESTHPA